MDRRASDIAFGAAFLAIAAAFQLVGRDLEGVSEIFPEGLEIFMAAGGALLVWKGLRAQRVKAVDAEAIDRGRVAAVTGGSVAYALAIPVLGFYASSAAFLFILSFAFAGRGEGAGRLARPALFTAVMVLSVYLVFQVLLGVPTPQGYLP